MRIIHRGKNYVLCDSPGFEDTNGPEVDIANCLGIVKAIRGCKSVKPIILLSNKSGDRFQAVKELAHMLVGMIPSIQEHLPSFSYVFTKFPPKELDAIPSILKSIIDNFKPEESADESFTTLIYDIQSKINMNGPTTIDVIKDNRELTIERLLSTAKIAYPEEVFKVSISPQSKSAVQEQALKHQLTIISAAKRANFELVKYKLDDLQEINKFLNQDSIKNVYEECLRYLVKLLDQNYQESVSYFNQRLTSKNALSEDDLVKYKGFIKTAENAEIFRDSHLTTETVSLAAYENKVRDEIETLCSKSITLGLDDILIIKDTADKVKLLSSAFPAFGSNYQELKKNMSELIESSFKRFKTATENADFQQSGKELQRLYLAQQSLKDHLEYDILQKFTLAQKFFITMLTGASSKFDEWFKKSSLFEKEVTQISEVVKMLTIAKETYNLQPHIPLETINDNYIALIKNIENFFHKSIVQIEKKLKEDSKNSFESFESDVDQITLIRTIPGIDFKTSESYFTMLNKIFNSVKDVRIEIERSLMLIFEKGLSINFKELNIYLARLKSAKWIEKYREGLYQDIFSDVQRQITQHLNHLKKHIQETNLDILDNYSQIIPTSKKISEALELQYLDEALPEIKKDVTGIIEEFTRATNKVLAQVIQSYKKDQIPDDVNKLFIEPSRIEKIFCYIKNCNCVSILADGDRTEAGNSLDSFLKAASQKIKDEFEKIIIGLGNYDANLSDKELVL